MPSIEERVALSVESALSDQHHVSIIDVLMRMGLLAPTQFENWRKGRMEFLEEGIQGSPKKISDALNAFRRMADAKGLKPTETAYTVRTGEGVRNLQVTQTGDPAIEQFFRTTFVSPDLSERKRKNLEERAAKPPEIVVFSIIRDSACSECGVELFSGNFLTMQSNQSLCLACAGLDDLEYLPAGDAALTRRSTKYSSRTAVVVRFSRSRGRYERQGILVEEAALQKAEQECADDADERAAARARGAEQRRAEDASLVARMTEEIARLFPHCPPDEARAIAQHTAVRGSGRVGRTADGRALNEGALTAAVTAAIRHIHTDYDSLLAAGSDRDTARARVAARVQAILADWR